MKHYSELMDAIFVGDRLTELCSKLWVHPKAIVGGYIPMMEPHYPLSRQLECVSCAMGNKRAILYAAYKKMPASLIVLEEDPAKQPNAGEMHEELLGKGLNSARVDFAEGLGQAILQAGEALNRRERAEAFKKEFEVGMSALASARADLGKRVVILLGISYPPDTSHQRIDKDFLLLETPGCTAEREILQPLGCVNAGAPLISDEQIHLEGVQSISGLRNLDKAAPDVILLTGDPTVGQRAIAAALRGNPGLLEKVPALAGHQVFAVPHYCSARIFKLPEIYNTWKRALSCC